RARVPFGGVGPARATVTGGVAGFAIPAISFTLNNSPVSLNPNGETGVDARTVDSDPLHAGSYTYKAKVASSDDYIGATSADEPLTVDRAQLSIRTDIHNANHGVVGGDVHVPLGSVVHDTATVTGGVAGFPIPGVAFTLNGIVVDTDTNGEAGVTARSVDSAPLHGGSYTYNATVASSD